MSKWDHHVTDTGDRFHPFLSLNSFIIIKTPPQCYKAVVYNKCRKQPLAPANTGRYFYDKPVSQKERLWRLFYHKCWKEKKWNGQGVTILLKGLKFVTIILLFPLVLGQSPVFCVILARISLFIRSARIQLLYFRPFCYSFLQVLSTWGCRARVHLTTCCPFVSLSACVFVPYFTSTCDCSDSS